jgi:hypothetical protein
LEMHFQELVFTKGIQQHYLKNWKHEKNE